MSTFRTKFNPRQHGFIKSKTTATNHVVYLDLINPRVQPQGQFDAIYFDFGNVSDLLPTALPLCKPDDFGLPPAYVTRFHSYLTQQIIPFEFDVILTVHRR